MLTDVIHNLKEIFGARVEERKGRYRFDDSQIKNLTDAMDLLDRADRETEYAKREQFICLALIKAAEVNAFEQEESKKR